MFVQELENFFSFEWAIRYFSFVRMLKIQNCIRYEKLYEILVQYILNIYSISTNIQYIQYIQCTMYKYTIYTIYKYTIYTNIHNIQIYNISTIYIKYIINILYII